MGQSPQLRAGSGLPSRRDGQELVSVGGARLHFEARIEVPQELSLRMPRGGKVHRHCEVVWQRNFEMGVRFVNAGPAVIDLGSVTHEIEYL
jgi:hypothetical protein